MELITVRIPRTTSNDHTPIYIAPIGDIQWSGERGPTAQDTLKRHIERCQELKAWYVGLGDYTDFLSPSNRQRLAAANLYDTAQDVVDDKAVELVHEVDEKFLRPTHGRWLGLVEGHHFSQLRSGDTTDQRLCQILETKFLGTCFAPHTRVLTADLRWQAIGDVRVGDSLLSFDEAGPWRHWRPTTVVNVQRHLRRLWRVRLSDGTELLTTAEHPFLAEQRHRVKWVPTADLLTRSTHRRLTRSRLLRVARPWDVDTSYDGGWLAGFFDGEGSIIELPSQQHLGGRYLVSAAQVLGPTWERLQKVLNEKGFQYSTDVREPQQRSHQVLGRLRIIGGREAHMEFLGRIRPSRLLAQFHLDGAVLNVLDRPQVVEAVDTGIDGEVVNLETTTRTFVAEGFAVHNSAYIRLIFELSRTSMGTVVLWVHHGCGAGMTDASPLNRLKLMASHFEGADVYMMGHTTKSPATRMQKPYPLWNTPGGPKLVHREALLINTGGFSRAYQVGAVHGQVPRGGYAEQKMLPPSSIGAPIIEIRPYVHEQGSSKNPSKRSARWAPEIKAII